MGEIAAVVRLVPRTPAATGFLVTAGSTAFDLLAPAGDCGKTVAWPAAGADLFRARYCDGVQLLYRLDISGDGDYRLAVTDLSNPGMRKLLAGRGAASYKITKPLTQWLVDPQDLSFAASAVVNAANFTADIAAGGLISIFGSGLARAGGTTTVEIGGLPATVVAASAFQLNVYVPPALAPGTAIIRVTSPYGALERQAAFAEFAPAVFVLSNGRAAIVNQDGTINSPSAPARRGQVVTIYGTCFGAVRDSGKYKVVTTPVTALLQGQELPVVFAGLTPGFFGLYQVNLLLPAPLPPGLGLPLVLKQGAATSAPVEISVQ
jgi:uncharacterized protein (TIGR03437 family)